jgi:ABC-type molybdate transport system substrate-binding protein
MIPGLTWARFPDQINVAAVYGIGASIKAPIDADAFIQFVTGPEGRRIFDRYGFK